MTTEAKPDPIAAVLAAFALQEHEDEFRALLLQSDAGTTPAALAAALTCLLMLRSGVSRTAVTVVGRQLFALAENELAAANVVVMDGTQLYCPSPGADGKIFRLPSMELVDPSTVTEPLVTTVFNAGRALLLCKGIG